MQDIPLLAVLRSPLVGLSLDELADIRLAAPRELLWTALNRWREVKAKGKRQKAEGRNENAETSEISSGDSLGKINEFLRQFTRWRRVAREGSLSECLEAALAETHYEALLQAGARGEERVANVRQLLALARQFDPFQRQGLFRFLRFVAAQQEAGLETEPAPLPTQEAVRLMSIHKSKGLEFPVVVLAGLGTCFNLQDLYVDILLNDHYGLCPKVLPPEADQRYPSLPHWLASQRERRELLGEEMRLLYVAATRARDTLLLVGTASSREAGQPWSAADSRLILDREILNARSPLDWIRLWLPQVTAVDDWRDEQAGENALLRWSLYAPDDPRLLTEKAAEISPTISFSEPDAPALQMLRERILWQYPHSAATIEPAKTTVSVLRRRTVEEADEDSHRLLWRKAEGRRQKAKVERSGAHTLSAAERGSAHHTFLQFVQLDRTESQVDLRNEAERLKAQGVLSADELAVLDFDALLDFWQARIGRRVRAQAAQVHREIPFTAKFTPRELDDAGIKLARIYDSTLETPPDWSAGLEPALRGMGAECRPKAGAPLAREKSGIGSVAEATTLAEEFIVVQGTVDLAVIQPEEIWLVDFKTDRIRPSELDEKVASYEPQLKLYALALERIYRRTVSQRWLHFLDLGESVAVACGTKFVGS